MMEIDRIRSLLRSIIVASLGETKGMITNDESLVGATRRDAAGVAELPSRVLVALDHVQPEERTGVLDVVAGFARGEVAGRRLPGADPVFRLQAAPDLLVFVRREIGALVEVLDIVRPDALRTFADAAIDG
jgi:hypothetical protein